MGVQHQAGLLDMVKTVKIEVISIHLLVSIMMSRLLVLEVIPKGIQVLETLLEDIMVRNMLMVVQVRAIMNYLITEMTTEEA